MDCSRPASRNPDRWITHCPAFSRPLCEELRERIQRWEPDLVESVKWNMLCFSGRKLVCGLSGCKAHVGITFFRGVELSDPAGLFSDGETNASIRGIRLTAVEHWPREHLRRLLRAAVVLDADPDRPPLPPRRREPWPVPDFFRQALAAHPRAAAAFAAFPPSAQREYVVWIDTARRPETRERRLAETLAALSAGRRWIDRKG